MELVVTIARGADEPKLDRYDLERVVVRVHRSSKLSVADFEHSARLVSTSPS